MDKKKGQKGYYCELCNFSASCNAKYVRHLNTKKHKNAKITMDNKMDNKKGEKGQPGVWVCNCGKTYKFQSGLCKHKLNCKVVDMSKNSVKTNLLPETENTDEYKDMFFKMFNENQEFKKLIIDQQEQLKTQSQQLSDIIPKLGNSTNNTINQKFNINIFLNENCKNAINMTDFINSIKISVEELDMIKTNGLASGLSNAIINNMQRLTIEERPIHCTDIKRETIYIKDQDKWGCDVSKQSIKQSIKLLSGKPYSALHKWKQDNPDFMNSEQQQEYFARALQVLGENNVKLDEKVIKSICNYTYLNKLLH